LLILFAGATKKAPSLNAGERLITNSFVVLEPQRGAISCWIDTLNIAKNKLKVNMAVILTLPIVESMNANTILNDDMSLEEKLKAIQELMDGAEAQNKSRVDAGLAPIDPADLTMCEGCQ
jgi:hypothetical protein